jgi:hypothetical protein
MNWKIQARAPYGWGDVQSNNGKDDSYRVDHYRTRAGARAQMKDFPTEGRGEYRVVRADTPSDYDLYT